MPMTIESVGNVLRDGSVESLVDRRSGLVGVDAPSVSGSQSHESTNGASFGDFLKKSLDDVNQMQLQADRGASELVAGRNKNIHETMLLLEKADMSFRLAMQVRNKVLDAYREVMRMQV